MPGFYGPGICVVHSIAPAPLFRDRSLIPQHFIRLFKTANYSVKQTVGEAFLMQELSLFRA